MSLPDLGKITRKRIEKARQQAGHRHFSRAQRRRMTKRQAKCNLRANGIPRRNSRAFYEEWDRLMRRFPMGTIEGA